MGPHELAPFPARHTLDYQELHPELEGWAVFRSLPMMMSYDQAMTNFIKSLNNGTMRVPDWVKNFNPPSLFAYYNTLPKWARDHPAVRNVLMAYEYRHPTMDFRQKETAMNFMMSFIRPIDQRLEDVIIEVATSTKLKMNVARGKEMISELKFYEMDPFDLGTVTEGEPEEEQLDDSGRVINRNAKTEEELKEEYELKSAMEKFASGVDENARERELHRYNEKEMDIT